jgi:RNA polymerase-binding transcription factor DksA
MEYWELRKMKRLNRIRLCKSCGKVIDNSKRKINKRTKFCSEDCVEDYNKAKKERSLKNVLRNISNNN